MIEKAIKILDNSLLDLGINSKVGDSIVEAIALLQDYVDADKIIEFVMEHYTTEQIVCRCSKAVIREFGDDYREFTIRKESRK